MCFSEIVMCFTETVMCFSEIVVCFCEVVHFTEVHVFSVRLSFVSVG